jgi:hypothetical protein
MTAGSNADTCDLLPVAIHMYAMKDGQSHLESTQEKVVAAAGLNLAFC